MPRFPRTVARMTVFAAVLVLPFAAWAQGGPRQPGENTPTGAVMTLSVQPGSGHADVVIGIDGAADVVDFPLDGGKRIVVDFKGAVLGLGSRQYDGVARGSIANVRFAQNKSDVVRVVLDLDAPREYTVVRGEHDVRISVNGSDAFQPWSVGNRANTRVTSAAVAPAVAPAFVTAAQTTPQSAQQTASQAAQRDQPSRRDAAPKDQLFHFLMQHKS